MLNHSSKVIKSQEIIGEKVYNLAKDKLGEIEEIVIDKLTGRIAYIVLATGNFLGMKGKYLAIPWHLLEYDSKEKYFVLEIEKETIKNVPGFDKNFWPDRADKTFIRLPSEVDSNT